MTVPSVWVEAVTFSDGTQVRLRRDDLVVVVGPNNSGKSEFLRNVLDLVNTEDPRLVARQLEIGREGSLETVLAWLRETARETKGRRPEELHYRRGVHAVRADLVPQFWSRPRGGLRDLTPFFCYLLSAEERLKASDPPPSIPLTTQPFSHPIHHLQADDSLEMEVSQVFRRAFGVDLVVHRNAGNNVPLYCGERPKPKPDEDRLSIAYIRELEKLPALKAQGDGMRAYAGILLNTIVVQHSVLLIDEPEAFLHPPQIRQLARVLATSRATGGQLFVATHSGDFVRAAIEANSPRVRILRLQRDGAVNRVKELDNDGVRELWGDPLLRYSNVLDCLFHSKTVVTEADGDCRFYAAVADALGASADTCADVFFTHCGGKDRLPTAIRALQRLGVPVAAIADFDVLSNENPLHSIYEALGGDWETIRRDWLTVKSAVEKKTPELSTREVSQQIQRILENVDDRVFPKMATEKITAVLRRSTPWSIAKDVGKQYIPPGEETQAFGRLMTAVRERGLFVVETGEMESFDRDEGNHGPAWVNAVLAKSLRDDRFKDARDFVAAVIG
jgi:ABC-type transport system involved in cytochrome c biogenesis ATPase subunit